MSGITKKVLRPLWQQYQRTDSAFSTNTGSGGSDNFYDENSGENEDDYSVSEDDSVFNYDE